MFKGAIEAGEGFQGQLFFRRGVAWDGDGWCVRAMRLDFFLI